MNFEPFYVGTIENEANEGQRLTFDVPCRSRPHQPFKIDDPFGLRKAVVPVFKRDTAGFLYGMGTAFHIDGFGTFLTAEHVVDFARESEYSISPLSRGQLEPHRSGNHPILFLGMGVVFGAAPAPSSAFAYIERITAHIQERDDPIKAVQGKFTIEHTYDIAAMSAIINTERKSNFPHSLKLNSYDWNPTIGEPVLAVGFPQLSCQPKNSSNAELTEAMYGAYGIINRIHKNGLSQTRQTPVIEISAEWPSGMSGGPVFNSDGQVIGLVSSSLYHEEQGIGYATCLRFIPSLNYFLPTVDLQNPGMRRGWGLFDRDTNNIEVLTGMFRAESEAQIAAASSDKILRISACTNKIGTDEFVIHIP